MMVWNLGLPRTGTTSVTAALAAHNMTCRPVYAHALVGNKFDLSHWTMQTDLSRPLICSVRPFDSWAKSFTAQYPEVDALVVYHQHWQFLAEQSVAVFDVREGYEGLFRALAQAMQGRELPHLNARV